MATKKTSKQRTTKPIVAVRVSEEVKKRFEDKAKDYADKPSVVLRQIIEAFNEDRLIINPPSDQKRSLYNEH